MLKISVSDQLSVSGLENITRATLFKQIMQIKRLWIEVKSMKTPDLAVLEKILARICSFGTTSKMSMIGKKFCHIFQHKQSTLNIHTYKEKKKIFFLDLETKSSPVGCQEKNKQHLMWYKKSGQAKQSPAYTAWESKKGTQKQHSASLKKKKKAYRRVKAESKFLGVVFSSDLHTQKQQQKQQAKLLNKKYSQFPKANVCVVITNSLFFHILPC